MKPTGQYVTELRLLVSTEGYYTPSLLHSSERSRMKDSLTVTIKVVGKVFTAVHIFLPGPAH